MVIKDNRKKERKIKEFKIGECFMYGDELYLVTEDVVVEQNVCDNYCDSDVLNALDLKNGFLHHFDGELLVEPVEVEVIIS